ncbi:MAG: YdcF family protein [Rickettsiaceae bacterium]|nr:YdcF family protein [Rickettsiaceae bacterium]
MDEREIPKLPEVPHLDKETIDMLTKLCFRQDNNLSLYMAETVFMFGTSVSLKEAERIVLDVIKKVRPKLLVLTGGMPKYNDSYYIKRPESENFYDIIKDKILTPIEIKIENKSNNSLENVQFSFPLLASSQSIIFITKNFAAGRHFLILKKYFPNIPIFQKTYEPVYPDNNSIIISKNNWSNNVLTASRVWGEFLRIKSFEGSGNNYT